MKKLCWFLLNLVFVAVFLFGVFSFFKFFIRWFQGSFKENWHFFPIAILCFAIAHLLEKGVEKLKNSIEKDKNEKEYE